MKKSDKAILSTTSDQRTRVLRHFVPHGNGCWIWELYKDKKGYGRIGIMGAMVLPHRLAIFHSTGVLGEVAMHSCDNPSCGNPAHLSWSTQLANIADRGRKGRTANVKGEKNPAAKLNAEKVAEIRAIGRTKSLREISQIYGVDLSLISLILLNKIWKIAA